MVTRRDFLTGLGAAGGVATLGWSTYGCSSSNPSSGSRGASNTLGTTLPTGRDGWARMPAAFNRKVTTETSEAALDLLDGALPDGLAGHVFFQSLALGPDDAGLSGDPLVWRVDLAGATPRITSKLLRSTDYLLGQAFADTDYRFDSHGMLRLGKLGLQDQPNTAFVRMEGNRLFATVDGGRPWEFDPASLAPVGPLGRLADYRSMTPTPAVDQQLCPMMITSAHPPYDPETGEYYGVSLSIIPGAAGYFEVLCWSGEGTIKRVPLVLGDGQPLVLTQNAHQIAVTRHHLVIVDAAGTIEFEKLASAPNSKAAGTFRAPSPDSHFFIVDRDELRRTTGTATARMATVPREVGHFMVDYASTKGRLVVHVPHTSASDFAEWIQPYDTHPDTHAAVRKDLVNAITPVCYDAGVVGRYEIDSATGDLVDQSTFHDEWTWGTGGLTARNPNTPATTLGDLFHVNSGFPTDLAVQRVYDGFTDYPHRLVALDDLPWKGIPSSLVRIDHDAGRIVDGYRFAGDRFAWTPTFVPRNGTAKGAADGHLVVVVFSDDKTKTSSGVELWVFDAGALADGPVAKLGRADLEVPMTVHSIWLDSLNSSRPDERVDVGAELTARAATWSEPQVAGIVASDVLPAYAGAVG
ncbi:MAG TPA: carotenoid oxygenase family protein [Acidimicrobiales bacterium]|nr:carotenoid oxygenase family protein [Acidimicrobiales bacterium]